MSSDDVVIINESIEESRSQEVPVSQELKGRKLSWQKLRRNDSLDIESRTVSTHHGHTSKVSSTYILDIYLHVQLINCIDLLAS